MNPSLSMAPLLVIIGYQAINLLPFFEHYSQLCHYSVPIVMTGSGFQSYQNQAKTVGIVQATRLSPWNTYNMHLTMTVSIAWSHGEPDHRRSFLGTCLVPISP